MLHRCVFIVFTTFSSLLIAANEELENMKNFDEIGNLDDMPESADGPGLLGFLGEVTLNKPPEEEKLVITFTPQYDSDYFTEVTTPPEKPLTPARTPPRRVSHGSPQQNFIANTRAKRLSEGESQSHHLSPTPKRRSDGKSGDKGSPKIYFNEEQIEYFINQGNTDLMCVRTGAYRERREKNDDFALGVVSEESIRRIKLENMLGNESETPLAELSAALNTLTEKRQFKSIIFKDVPVQAQKLLPFVQAIKNQVEVLELEIEGCRFASKDTDMIIANIAEILKGDNLTKLVLNVPFTKDGWRILGLVMASKITLKSERDITITNSHQYDGGADEFIHFMKGQAIKFLDLKCAFKNKKGKDEEFNLLKGVEQKKQTQTRARR